MRPLKGIEKAAKIKVHVYFDFAVHLGLNLGPTQGLHGQSWAKISPLKRIEKAAKIKVHVYFDFAVHLGLNLGPRWGRDKRG